MKVIAISAWKGSGKDMLAAHLIDKFNAVRTSFADPLKDMVAEQYGIDRTSLDDPSRKESPLLNMPVDPQDGYSRMIADFLRLEFRTADGRKDEGAETVFWTPRALAILEGSTKRSVTSKYWVQRAIKKIQQGAFEGEELQVISDLRYKSEMQQLRDAFGPDVVFVRVNRFAESPSKDPSERDLDDATFDYYVDNTTTKEAAFAQIEAILAKITTKTA